MSRKFAKLFDTPDGQLLVTIDGGSNHDDTEWGPCWTVRASGRCGIEMREGPWPDTEHSWALLEERLAEFDQAKAEAAAERLTGAAKRLLDE